MERGPPQDRPPQDRPPPRRIFVTLVDRGASRACGRITSGAILAFAVLLTARLLQLIVPNVVSTLEIVEIIRIDLHDNNDK